MLPPSDRRVAIIASLPAITGEKAINKHPSDRLYFCMISNIYLLKNGQPTGPLSDDELMSLRRKGLITDNDLLWHDKLPDWISGSEYFGVKTVEPPIQPSKLHLSANSSFCSFHPGTYFLRISALTIFAVLQIGFEVLNNSTPIFNHTSKRMNASSEKRL